IHNDRAVPGGYLVLGSNSLELERPAEDDSPRSEDLTRRQELLQRRAGAGRRVGEHRGFRAVAHAPDRVGVQQVVEIERRFEGARVRQFELLADTQVDLGQRADSGGAQRLEVDDLVRAETYSPADLTRDRGALLRAEVAADDDVLEWQEVHPGQLEL